MGHSVLGRDVRGGQYILDEMSGGQLFLGQNVRRTIYRGTKLPATPAQLKVKRRGSYASVVGCIAKETAIRYGGFTHGPGFHLEKCSWGGSTSVAIISGRSFVRV